jgi:hypothetical protein
LHALLEQERKTPQSSIHTIKHSLAQQRAQLRASCPSCPPQHCHTLIAPFPLYLQESAQGYYGVMPDLTCMGKVIGGGLPVGAFGGRKDIMSMVAPAGPMYQAGTLSGNPLAMTAGAKVRAVCVYVWYICALELCVCVALEGSVH